MVDNLTGIASTAIGGTAILAITLAGCIAASTLTAVLHSNAKRREDARRVLRDLLAVLRRPPETQQPTPPEGALPARESRLRRSR